MKKLLSLILSFVLLISGVVFAKNDTTSKNDYASKVLVGLGLMDAPKTEAEWQDVMTRGEIANIVYRILNYEMYDTISATWASTFYGDKTEGTDLITDLTSDELYNDVDLECEFYDAIAFLNENGIMSGYGDGYFGVNDPIKPLHAAKIILDIMGYKSFVEGFEDKNDMYTQLAYDLELIVANGDSMTKAECAQFVYNALGTQFDSNVGDNVSFDDGEHTILERYLKLSYAEGTMTDNGYVSINGSECVGADRIKIGDLVLNVKNIGQEKINWLGRHVGVFFVDENRENAYQTVFMLLTDKDDCIQIRGREVESYNKKVLKYYDDSKVKDVTFAGDVSIIYNYQAVETWDESLFTSPNSVIKLISSKNSKDVGVVIIEDYTSVLVQEISGTRVYNKILSPNASSVKDFDPDEKTVVILKSDGSVGSIKDIKSDKIVDVIEGEDIIIGKISDTVVDEFKIALSGSDRFGSYYSNGSNNYYVNDSINNAENKPLVSVGKIYKAYINSFGDIAWLSNIDTDSKSYAFLLKTIPEEYEDHVCRVKILNPINEWKIIEMSEKVTFSNQYGAEKKMYCDEAYNDYLNSYRGLIRYRVNEEGKISYIEIPIVDSGYNYDGKLILQKSVGYEDANSDGKPDGALWRDNGSIDKNLIVRHDSIFLVQNPELDPASEEAYSFKSNILEDYKSYTLDAYVTVAGSPNAEYVKVLSNVGQEMVLATDPHVAVVKDLYYTLVDGEEVACVDVFDLPQDKIGSDVTLYMKDSTVLNNVQNVFKDTDPDGNPITYDLGIGDIIRYSLDVYGKVNQIYLYWDYDKPNQTSSLGKTGGWAGTIDWWQDDQKGHTNPFGFSGEAVKDDAFSSIAAVNLRSLSGYVYKKFGDVLTVTTQDLSVTPYDKLADPTKYSTESYRFHINYKIATITINGDKISGKAFSLDDVKPYDIYGKDCSRVIVMGQNGGMTRSIIINDVTE